MALLLGVPRRPEPAVQLLTNHSRSSRWVGRHSGSRAASGAEHRELPDLLLPRPPVHRRLGVPPDLVSDRLALAGLLFGAHRPAPLGPRAIWSFHTHAQKKLMEFAVGLFTCWLPQPVQRRRWLSRPRRKAARTERHSGARRDARVWTSGRGGWVAAGSPRVGYRLRARNGTTSSTRTYLATSSSLMPLRDSEPHASFSV